MMNDDDDDYAFAKATVIKDDNNDDDDVTKAKVLPIVVDGKTTPLSLEIEGGGGIEEGGITTTMMKGEVQADTYRDSWASIAFILQFVVVVFVSIHYSSYLGFYFFAGSEETTTDNDTISTLNNTKFALFLILVYVISGLSTWGALKLMMRYSESVVKFSFFVAPVTFTFSAILLTVIGGGNDDDDDLFNIIITITIIISLIMVCLWVFYKKHVPFAAANLRTALSALRVNSGTYSVAFLFSVVSFLTFFLSIHAIIGVQAKADLEKVPCQDEDGNDSTCEKPIYPFFVVMLLFCCFWTQQVVTNIVHVTTAGTIGAWWFSPPLAEYNYNRGICCSHSSAVTGSLHRACTYSFGSICYGSLLIAILQTLEQLARRARGNRRAILLSCLMECLLSCLRGWMEYFNSWAFVYIALYGYPYIEAGKNVMTLFQTRGWMTIIADRLVFRVLFFCNLALAAFVGSMGVLCNFGMNGFRNDDRSSSMIESFWIAFLIAFLISNTVLFVVESAVRTVIVCFAESPAEFQEHHSELYEPMQAAWTEAYPTVTFTMTVTHTMT